MAVIDTSTAVCFSIIIIETLYILRSEDGKENQTPGRQFRPLYDIPFMFEAREFLRKRLIGKKVNVTIDYVQPSHDQFPEKTCCTVIASQQ